MVVRKVFKQTSSFVFTIKREHNKVTATIKTTITTALNTTSTTTIIITNTITVTTTTYHHNYNHQNHHVYNIWFHIRCCRKHLMFTFLKFKPVFAYLFTYVCATIPSFYHISCRSFYCHILAIVNNNYFCIQLHFVFVHHYYFISIFLIFYTVFSFFVSFIIDTAAVRVCLLLWLLHSIAIISFE